MSLLNLQLGFKIFCFVLSDLLRSHYIQKNSPNVSAARWVLTNASSCITSTTTIMAENIPVTHRSPLQPLCHPPCPSNHWAALCHYSFSFIRISYTGTHKLCIRCVWLLYLSRMLLRSLSSIISSFCYTFILAIGISSKTDCLHPCAFSIGALIYSL